MAFNRGNLLVGPGAYDPKIVENVYENKVRSNTAAFLGKRSDNVFEIKDRPGPTDYHGE